MKKLKIDGVDIFSLYSDFGRLFGILMIDKGELPSLIYNLPYYMCMSILTSYPAFSHCLYLSIFLFPTLYSFSSTAYSKDSPRRLFLRNFEFLPAKLQRALTLSSSKAPPLSSRSRCVCVFRTFTFTFYSFSI